MAFLKHLLTTGVVAALAASSATAHSALLANGKLLGKLNSGDCMNCAVGSYPVPSSIPASAVDASSPADGLAAYIKSSGTTVKDTWNLFHAGTTYGGIVEPDAIKSGTCGRYDPTAVGDVPSGATISYKKANHKGPAEIWVDDKKVWYGDDFITDGKSIKADTFKCAKATCNVHWYWLGKVKVKNQWNYYQLYTQCFVVKGSGTGGAAASDDDAPAATTAKTAAPASSGDDAAPGTVAPADNSSGSTSPDDSKAARKAEKEKRKADKAAAKAAKEAAKNGGSSNSTASTDE